jgi:hypothetical protein
MPDTIFRQGKAILKVYDVEDRKVMKKAMVVRPEHIMRLTGAPGWDKEAVDETFTKGVKGGIAFTFDFIEYEIDINVFREHAFEKDTPPFGAQYHVHAKYWTTRPIPKVSAVRTEEAAPTPPKRITFGEWIPCPRCKGQSKSCDTCNGVGYQPWK